MRRWLLLGWCGSVLAGCGMFGGAKPAPADPFEGLRQTPDYVACARLAEDDPEVKRLMIVGLGNQNFFDGSQERLRIARNASIRRCLQSRGVFRPGGVERQKPLS